MLPPSPYNILIIQFTYTYVIITEYLVSIITLNKLLYKNNKRFYFNSFFPSQTLPDPSFLLFKKFTLTFLIGLVCWCWVSWDYICLRKSISPSLLKGHFFEQNSRLVMLFFLSTVHISLQSLLVCMVSDKKSTVIYIYW